MTFLNEKYFIQVDFVKSLAILFLFLSINYVPSTILTSEQEKYIYNHKWAQYLVSFMLFYFLIVISDTGQIEFLPPIEKLFYAICYFILFLLIIRLDFVIFSTILFLTFLI